VIAWVSAASFFTEHMSVITALAHQDRRRRTHSGHFWLVRRCDAPVGQINEYLNMDPPATSGNVGRCRQTSARSRGAAPQPLGFAVLVIIG